MKRVFIVLMLVVMALQGSAKLQKVCDEIGFEVGIVDPTENHEPLPKGPIVIPSVNDNVMYSTVIQTGTTSLVLPSFLSGDYKIQIIQGYLCFYGFIYL